MGSHAIVACFRYYPTLQCTRNRDVDLGALTAVTRLTYDAVSRNEVIGAFPCATRPNVIYIDFSARIALRVTLSADYTPCNRLFAITPRIHVLVFSHVVRQPFLQPQQQLGSLESNQQPPWILQVAGVQRQFWPNDCQH